MVNPIAYIFRLLRRVLKRRSPGVKLLEVQKMAEPRRLRQVLPHACMEVAADTAELLVIEPPTGPIKPIVSIDGLGEDEEDSTEVDVGALYDERPQAHLLGPSSDSIMMSRSDVGTPVYDATRVMLEYDRESGAV